MLYHCEIYVENYASSIVSNVNVPIVAQFADVS